MKRTVAAATTALRSCESLRWREAAAELADARLRQLVAQRLGLDAAQLHGEAALADDLGADETDLLEIAVAVEEEFGLAISDVVLRDLRTYGDLAEAVARLLRRLEEPGAAEPLASAIMRVRLIHDRPDRHGAVVRVARLTPRVLQGIVDEVLRTSGVVRLEVSCAGDITDRQLAGIAHGLAWLRARGVQVSVQRLGQETVFAAPMRTGGDTVSHPHETQAGRAYQRADDALRHQTCGTNARTAHEDSRGLDR